MAVDVEAIKTWVRSDWDAQEPYRAEMVYLHAFRDGDQWTDEERKALETASRLPIVFNRVAPILASVAGSEINNRTEVRFIPREIGDAKPNEVLTSGAQWFRDESNAEDEESQSFDDVLVCGIGWTETYLDFDVDYDGAPRLQRVDPIEMCWDQHARRKGLQDMTRCARVREVPIEQAREMFPGFSDDDLDAGWITAEEDDAREELDDEGHSSLITIVQAQWRTKEKCIEYVDPATGAKKDMPADEWAKLLKQMPEAAQIQHRTKTKMVWRQAFVGNVLLAESQPCKDHCTFQAMTGMYDRKAGRWYGLLRHMIDPQKYANKWLSQTLHIIAANSKGGVIVEDGAVDDMEDFEAGWGAADSVSIVKAGAISAGRIQPKPSVQMPAALMNMTQFAITSIRDVSGVNMELMGMREANQAGVLEYQRREAAMTTLAAFFDSLRFYRKRQGEVILCFLVDWIAPTGRLVRLVEKGQEKYVSLATEGDTRKYDVIVGDSPQAPNEKERTWAIIEKMMPVLQAGGLSLEDWADVLSYSPLPSSFADKVRAKAEERKGQPDPQQQLAEQMAQAEVMKVKTEAQENESQVVLNQARAAEIGMRAIMPAPQPMNGGL